MKNKEYITLLETVPMIANLAIRSEHSQEALQAGMARPPKPLQICT
jgi:hypothetical protein